jgi:hypothetical protein
LGKDFGFLTGLFFTGFLTLGTAFLGGLREIDNKETRRFGFFPFIFPGLFFGRSFFAILCS